MPAQVEFSAMHLPLLPIYLEAISGSSCICWQTKIAAFLRATILVSDRGSMPFCWTTTLTSNILLFRATSVEQKKRTPERGHVSLTRNWWRHLYTPLILKNMNTIKVITVVFVFPVHSGFNISLFDK